MNLFSIKTTIKDIEPYINWNTPVLDFYLGIEKRKQDFEKEFSRALKNKRKEILYFELYSNSKDLLVLSTKLTKEDVDEEYWYHYEDRRWFSYLKNEILIQYQNGSNPPIDLFKETAIRCIEYEINSIFNDPWENPEEYINLSLEEAANKLTHNVFSSMTHAAIGTVDYRDFLLEHLSAIEESSSQRNKIKWEGTPGEFGAIFSSLIENGFIKQSGDLKNMVQLLENVFDVKTEKGESPTSRYLYRCFNEKKKVYFPHEFKMPLSENYDIE